MEGEKSAAERTVSDSCSSCGSSSEESDEDFRICHSFSMHDYVVIHNCEPVCAECQFVHISDKQALQIRLCEERSKNEKYREKLKELLKKYSQSLRQLEHQKSVIGKLNAQLREARENALNGCMSTEYAVIESALIEDWQNLEVGHQRGSMPQAF